MMHQNPIEVLSRSLGRTEKNIIELVDEAIKCKSFFQCFAYDHEETAQLFMKNKVLLALKLSLKYLLCAGSHNFKVKVKFRLFQYFTWKQIDFGNSSRFRLLKEIRRRIYSLFASRIFCNLRKAVGWDISPFTIIEKGFWNNAELMNVTATALSRIGKNVCISNGVTLVAGSSNKEGQVRLPNINEGAIIWTGAVIVGAKIGKHAVVGANSVVLQDVPDNATVLGSPAKVVFIKPSGTVKAVMDCSPHAN